MDELAQLLGDSRAISLVREKLRQLLEGKAAGRRLPAMLIQGETGTGKGLVARLVHRMGPRKGGPFVDINCPAIPESLLEAELFGFERGAFTDAHRAKPGLFQAAHGGTLFLDEVGLLPESVQAKLLTVIEERSVRRLGSTRSEAVDACFISATNIDLRAALRDRHFREDLYHRLAVITLDLPALRDRDGDVLLLAERFLARTCAEYGLPPKRLDAEAQVRLRAHAWPGNIRELANVIERATLFAESSVITGAMLDPLEVESPLPAVPATGAIGGGVTPEDAMRQHLVAAMEEGGWNISHTATRLGIARNTLYARLAKYGVSGHRPPQAHSRRPSRPATGLAPVPAGTHVHWERRGITLLSAIFIEPDCIDAWSLTSRALDVVIDKLQTFGGRIEELTPTGIVASFGVDPVDDGPRRAAHAAIAIHKRAARTDESASRVPGVKIGIHVAQVLVGRSETRVDINADAKREHRSALDHLLETIETDVTVVTAAAAPFLERRFELVPMDAGEESADGAYRLTGQEQRGLGLWGAMTQFVGREDEIEVLRSRVAETGRGRGQLVAIVGEPGVGKSRLTWEFTHSSHVNGWLVLQAGAVPYGKNTAYLPAIELLKAYCGIGDRDDRRAIREKVTGKVLALDQAFEFALPALLTLLDLPVEDREWEALDPLGRRRRTLDALKRLLIRESKVQPLVLVFEDLHWIDGETQALLDDLVDALGSARLLLLVNYRPEYQHTWGSKEHHVQVRLEALPAENAGELLDTLLGDEPGLAPLKQLLVKLGNPFFLEETIRTLVETKTLGGQRGRYRPTQPVQAIQIPPTVQLVLAARIDRLSDEDKRLLQLASVVGTDVPYVLLQAIADLPDEALRRGLDHLQTAELLYETEPYPDLEYAFKHALTHEVTYGGLLQEWRCALHARLVSAIEQLYPERLAEHVNELAHHAYEGQLWEKALQYCREAASKAWAGSAHAAAVEYLDRTLIALDHLPDQAATAVDAVDLRCELRNSLYPLGRLGRIDTVLRDAEQAALRLDEPERLARVRSYQAHYLWISGKSRAAADAAHRALALATSIDHFGLKVASESYLGYAFHALGDYRQSIEVLNRVISRLDGELARDQLGTHGAPSVLCRTWLAFCHLELGEFHEGLRRSAEGIAIAQTTNHPYTLIIALQGKGLLLLRKGEASLAIAPLQHALALCQEWDLRLTYPGIAPHLGLAYAMLGDIERGLPLVETAIERAVEMGFEFDLAHRVTELGRVYLLAGRLLEAEGCATRALGLARDRQERGNEAWAFWLRAEIAVATGDIARAKEAEDHFSTALALANELTMRPLVARCHLGLGQLYRQGGQTALSSASLAAANTLFLELDMVP